MAGQRRVFGWCFIALVMITGCGGGDESADDRMNAASLGARPEKDRRAKGRLEEGGGEAGGLAALAPARGPFLGQLPADTLMAVRVPEMARMREAWPSTVMAEALSKLDMDLSVIEPFMAMAMSEFESAMPAGTDPAALLSGFDGDVVFALVAVHPEAFQGQSVLPVTGVLYAQPGASTKALVSLMEHALTLQEGLPRFEAQDDGSRRVVFESGPARLEVQVSDERFALSFSPPGSTSGDLDAWASLPPQESFLGSHLMRSLAHAPSSGERTGCFECFVNLRPVWEMALALAPPEASQVMGAMHLESLYGVSFITELRRGMFEETIRLHSPTRRDLLSAILTTEPIDPDFLRWIPAGVDTAAMFALNPQASMAAVLDRLPEEMRASFEKELKRAERDLPGRLREDLLANLGPQVAVSTRRTAQGTMSGTLSVGVKSPVPVRRMVDFALDQSGMAAQLETHECLGVTFQCLPLPPMPQAPLDGSPCFAFTGGSMLLATSIDAMRDLIAAGEAEGELAPRGLADLVSREDPTRCLAHQSNLGAQILPLRAALSEGLASLPMDVTPALPSEESWREFCQDLSVSRGDAQWDESGLAFRTISGVPSMTLMAGAGTVAVGAAVAIPNLLKARLVANEKSVVRQFHSIAQAQTMFRELSQADTDGDGLAEYGYLGELSGATPVRGGGVAWEPPGLSSSWGALEGGVAQHAGYLFRMDLAGPQGQPIAEAAQGGAPKQLPPGSGEEGWSLYAWPAEWGQSGTAVYVVDESGQVFSSDNQSQRYSGLGHMPFGDAAFLTKDSNRERGDRSVRRGRDGALWTRIE